MYVTFNFVDVGSTKNSGGRCHCQCQNHILAHNRPKSPRGTSKLSERLSTKVLQATANTVPRYVANRNGVVAVDATDDAHNDPRATTGKSSCMAILQKGQHLRCRRPSSRIRTKTPLYNLSIPSACPSGSPDHWTVWTYIPQLFLRNRIE